MRTAFLISIGLLVIAVLVITLPLLSYPSRPLPALLAFGFGSLLGMAEIASRYRDEPLHAISSTPGIIYTLFNGIISFLSIFLIFRYPDIFGNIASDGLKAAFTAGFGATAVMRTRIAVIKVSDNKEVSIGPDYVISVLLQMIDRNIDRYRAAKRQAVVIEHLSQIRALGSFGSAGKYLFASLLAFQNLDDTVKAQLTSIFSEYERQTLPEDIKYLALGFVFLTIVGETHFASVLENAAKIRASDLPAQQPAIPTPAPKP